VKNSVKLYRQPRPKSCVMLASWPGIGDVSLTVARYLVDKLKAEEIGEVDALGFFEPIGIVVKDNVVENPRFPESKFYYWRNDKRGRSVVIFVGEEQPAIRGYDLVNCVLDVAQKLRVERVYGCAAAVTRIHHSEEPKVWGVATKPELVGEMQAYGVTLRGDLRIAGLNGLVMGIAKEREMEGICLLGEVPSYATQIANPKASLAVLKVLSDMVGLEVDFTELSEVAKQVDEEMARIAKRATAEFIDQFTEPIWEQGEDEDFPEN